MIILNLVSLGGFPASFHVLTANIIRPTCINYAGNITGTDLISVLGLVRLLFHWFRWITGVPGDFISGNRKITLVFLRKVDGFFVHPVGLEFRIDMEGIRIEDWFIGDIIQTFLNKIVIPIVQNKRIADGCNLEWVSVEVSFTRWQCGNIRM